MDSPANARILMCPPDFFGIEYEINPWMNIHQGADPNLASRQWQQLYQTLRDLGAEIDLIEPDCGIARPGVHGQRGPGFPRPFPARAIPVRRPPGGKPSLREVGSGARFHRRAAAGKA